MPALDKHIQQVLARLTTAIKQGAKPYLMADHLALSRMGPLSVKVVHDNGVTYVDNPATHWVLKSFGERAPESGAKDRAAHASQVMNELLKSNKSVDEALKKTQEGIAERIDKRIASAGGQDPAANEWFDKFRDSWNKQQPMSIKGDIDFDGYPDSPASPSPQRYLNSFLTLMDSLPPNAEVVLLSGSSAIVSNVAKWAEDDGHVHTVVVNEDEVIPQ